MVMAHFIGQLTTYALILALFSTPQTEGQSHLPAKGFGGEWIPLSPMILGDLVGGTNQKKWDAILGTFCHMVSGPEVLLPSPHLLDLMDFRAHEASRGGHLLEGVGEVMGPLMVIVGVVHFEICLPSSLDEVRVFSEGFLMVLLEKPRKGPPLFLPSVGMLLRSDV